MKKLLIAYAFTLLTLPAIAVTLMLFIALAEMVKKFGKKPVWVKTLIFLFVVRDYLLNWEVSGMFLQWPDGWGELVTGRLSRYKRMYGEAYAGLDVAVLPPMQKYRLWWAIQICRILSKYDPNHC